MAVLNIEKSFLTENRSVLDFLNQAGQGLYIPLYQREYSWDSDNIEQLIEDLTRGIQRIATGEIADDGKEIRFLGTIITVIEANKNNIYPVDPQAVPSRIEKLIDGQQRVSTIALIATILVKRLYEIRNKIKESNPIYDQVSEICDGWIEKLANVFSFDLQRGKPRLKPKIVRGAKDYWTRDKDVDIAYTSELSNYLGHFIKAYVDIRSNTGASTTLPCLSKDKYGDTLLYKNGRRVESWLKKVVATAHEGKETDDFAAAIDIIAHFSQDQLWDFDRQDLVDIIKEKDYTSKKTDSYILSELVQTLAVCHYLLERCCFTIIQPTDDDWAFDMFQSLNATGTPLTAIETFKPTIVNTADNEGVQFKDSVSDIAFKAVEGFLSEANTAQQKNKRTNDFLTSFFVALDGRTISTHFSYQRKALHNSYSSISDFQGKEEFIVRMGNYAKFYQEWLNYNGDEKFPLTESIADSELASMIILFLKASNHKMAITVLGTMYNEVIKNTPNAKDNFVKVVKAIGAFYFIWRAAFSNAGLDSTYREFFKKLSANNIVCSLHEVREHIKDTLAKKKVSTKSEWIEKSRLHLKYGETGNEIVRLALLIAAHDTISDPEHPGLIKPGRAGLATYLSREQWVSPHLKTIEHVAPQTQTDFWPADLYDNQTKPYNLVGNLTLLPQDLNSSVGNKGFSTKLMYYRSVAETDVDRLASIKQQAANNNIDLNDSTVELLVSSQYNQHLSSLASLLENHKWDKYFVEQRSERILNIVWDRVYRWIFEE